MARMPAVEAVLADYSTNQRSEFGAHIADELRAGAAGQLVGEIPYDPVRHLATDILPLSVMEEITGEPHVGVVLPQRPLDVSVILHQEDAEDHPGIIAAKHKIAQNIFSSIADSLPGMTDRLHTYIVGEGERLAYDTERMEPGFTPMETATSISKLCMSGLAFIVSDFRNLPLHEMTPQYFPSTVAVKVNHPYEIGDIPANRGVISLGGKKELNTDKPKVLNPYNANKKAQHQERIRRLQGVGIAVAQVILDYQKAQGIGFAIEATDASIANALRIVTPR